MISSLRGVVLLIDADLLVVDVGGVGFSVAVSPQLARASHVGDEITLHTSLIVRDDAFSLFGFPDREELTVFTQLLGVSGVGPKSAMGVLSSLTVDQIADAVAAEDDAPFRRVSGIGPKTAKLIVVQLAGKIDLARARPAGPASAPAAGVAAQVVSALVSLGWNQRVADEVVTDVTGASDAPDSVPALLKLALAQLGPARAEKTGA
ncbi:Holliday junction branch migration protein RuvA [Microbacterium sp. No. 7]|uniref:Holliday junction branch migration protein RuvA n=1 Tax=Microbacterium sp. No. 7 TaxID=1714373 RepID=UPI0006D066DE|nr:Holliday junction branch migration protein RuvA [Microbacterium sp. No. 7]ALJ20148.1 ATP-dependent DNA helicase RuvA [Microbacterium sp. No. 7]